VSPSDLSVRLPELERLKKLSMKTARAPRPAPEPQPQSSGILDPLTHFYTFQHFKDLLFVEVKRARRYGFPISLGIIEFDRPTVKVTPEINAQLLGGLALAIRRSLRDTDFPVIDPQHRVILLMPHTDLQGALVVCRRICERVARASLTVDGQVVHPTISAGVAAAPLGNEVSFSDLARQAQGALEHARNSGGNQVGLPLDEVAVPPATQSLP
jgi:diguanylate cyclase (GGDEF)-like protein